VDVADVSDAAEPVEEEVQKPLLPRRVRRESDGRLHCLRTGWHHERHDNLVVDPRADERAAGFGNAMRSAVHLDCVPCTLGENESSNHQYPSPVRVQ